MKSISIFIYLCMIATSLAIIPSAFSQTAEEYFNSAVKFGQQKDYFSTVDMLDKVITISEDEKQKLMENNQASRSADDNHDTSSRLTTISTRLKDAYALRGLAKFYMGDYYDAIEDYQEALKIKPDFYEILLKIAYTDNMINKTNEALDNCEKAISIMDSIYKISHSKSVLSSLDYAYYLRGVTKDKLRDYDGAISDLSKAIELNPAYTDAISGIGLIYMKKENYYQAIASFDKAITKKPANPELYFQRGVCRHKLNNLPAAETDFQKAISLDSNHSKAYYYIAVIRQIGQIYNEAVDYYTKSINKSPDFAEAWYSRGTARLKMGDFDNAITDFTQSIKLTRNFPEAFFSRGYAKSQVSDFKSALEDFNSAIKIRSDFAEAYNERAKVRVSLKDTDGAIKDCLEAIKLQPKNGDYHYYCGLVYYEIGNKDAACQEWHIASDCGYEDKVGRIGLICK